MIVFAYLFLRHGFTSDQVSFKFKIPCLPLSPGSWSYRFAPPCPAFSIILWNVDFHQFWSQHLIHLEATYSTYIGGGGWGCHLTHTAFSFIICACISFNHYKIRWCHIILVLWGKCELKCEARAHCLIQHTSALSQLLPCLHQRFPVNLLFFLWCFFLLLFLLIVCLHQNIPTISYTSEFSSLFFFIHIPTFHSPSTWLLLKTIVTKVLRRDVELTSYTPGIKRIKVTPRSFLSVRTEELNSNFTNSSSRWPVGGLGPHNQVSLLSDSISATQSLLLLKWDMKVVRVIIPKGMLW